MTRRQAWTVAIVATLTMTVSYIDRATLAALAPTVTKALAIDETEYGWLTSAFSFAYLVATPLAGWWIDRVGARRGLVGSVFAWTVVAALHAVVPGFATLFALRIALGFVEGPGFPGAAQTIQRVLPPGERARGFGVLFTGSSIGGMIAPVLAGALFSIGGWRFGFLGSAVVGLLWIPLWLVATGSTEVRARLDQAPAPVAVPRSSVRELMRDANVIRALLSILAVAPIFGFALGWGAKYLARTWHTPQADVGHYLWLPPLVFDAGAVVFGDLSSRQRRASGAPPRLLFAIGLVLCLALAAVPLAQSEWQGIALIGIAMAGGGAVYTLATSDLLSRVPAHSVSLAGGLMAGAQSLAYVMANPLIGASVDHYGHYDVAVVAIALWALPGSIAWLAWRPR